MNAQLLEIVTQIVTKLEAGTDLLIWEISRYYLISGLLHLLMVVVIVGLLSRFIRSAIATIDLTASDNQDRVDLIWKMVFRLLNIAVFVGAMYYSYDTAQQVVKVAVAPHVFCLEKLKELGVNKK